MIFFVDMFILANKLKKGAFFFKLRSLPEPLAKHRGTLGFRGTPVEKPCNTETQRQTSMPHAGFKPTIPVTKRPRPSP
jgi:hypothetical protein